MTFNLTNFKLLAFDVYGTLIDWETGIYQALLPLLSKLPAPNPHDPPQNPLPETREALLEAYTNLELVIQGEDPTLAYPKVLSTIYERLSTQLFRPISQREAEAFGSTIGTWLAFSDTVGAMQVLGSHYKLVVLSNVDRESFSRTLSGPLSGVRFDAVYTAQDIGSYKPDPRNLEYLIEHAGRDFGVKKEEILMVAHSLVHDHVPARKAGLSPSVWIRRAGDDSAMGGKIGEAGGQVRLGAAFDTLGDLAEEVKSAFGT